MGFVTWTILATYAGCLAFVAVFTQIIKNMGILKKVSPQIISYAVALVTLYPAYYFTGQLTAASAVLILFNAAIVSLASNGTYDAIATAIAALVEKFK